MIHYIAINKKYRLGMVSNELLGVGGGGCVCGGGGEVGEGKRGLNLA